MMRAACITPQIRAIKARQLVDENFVLNAIRMKFPDSGNNRLQKEPQ
jgi:hypothetical protein